MTTPRGATWARLSASQRWALRAAAGEPRQSGPPPRVTVWTWRSLVNRGLVTWGGHLDGWVATDLGRKLLPIKGRS